MTSTITKLPKVTQYVRNVGKSVAFASINAVKDNMPGIKGFTEDNNEVFRDIYGSVKNYRDTIRKMDRNIRNSNIYKAIEYGAKNMVEDAKSGNFYRDRTYENSEAILGIEDDTDFDFKMSSSESSGSSISSTKQLADSFNEAIGAAAIGNSTAVAQGTEMVIRSTKASTTILSGQIERSTATLHSGLGAVYNSINVVNQFLNGPMLSHMENSRIYFDSSLKIMQEQQAMMKEILEMQRNLYKRQEIQSRTSKIDQSMTADGNIDLRGYMNVVKGNVKDMMDMFGLSMFGKDSGMNLPMAIASAPFKLMLDTLADSLMPKNIKKSLRGLDGAVTSLFSNFIAKMNKNKDNIGSSGISYLLANILGIDIEKKDKINTSNYNKGAVPFDGITRKTIIEVIPGYLARIEAAITGASERHYDPYRGTWKSINEIEKSFDQERAKSIQSANRGITTDLADYRRRLSTKDQKALDQSLMRMMTKIYDDGGLFDPQIAKNGKRDSRGRRTRVSSGNAYKEYGFEDKKLFDIILSQMSDSTFHGLASNNMRARQSYARTMEQYELNGGVYNHLFNGAYDPSGRGKTDKMSPSKFTKNNLLSIARDEHGKNIFYYLREILKGINSRWDGGRSVRNDSTYTTDSGIIIVSRSGRETRTSSEESEGDSGSDDGDSSWYRASEEIEREEAEVRNKNDKQHAVTNWINNKFGKSPIGRFLSKTIPGISGVFTKPVEFVSNLLDKANESVFSMMFGDKELKDEAGRPITNVLEYMINKIKTSFDELGKWIKSKLQGLGKNLWDKIQPKAQPVIDELKSMGRSAKARVGKAFKNTFSPAVDAILDRLPPELKAKLTANGVVSADEVEGTVPEVFHDDDGYNYDNNLLNSARGRIVTKRGLTMISPGEIIIPASFNKHKQNKMLTLEKRDRRRILNHIGLNAKGNIDTEALKQSLSAIYNENKGEKKVARTTASGIVGLGAGLLTGINPLLAAAAGAGLSILNNSQTLQKIVFGEEVNGERKGGLIPKKIQDKFKEVLPDMGDYGIAGGVLGLLTPFGPLGGAAIGAGIGYLKHSEGFKKFIFGDEATGEQGIVSEEAWEKFKGHVKKAAPNMLIGAGAAILGGPFGLLGNAAMGAGLGLISSSQGFHNFLFGNEEEGTKGVLDAFRTGLLDPAKEKFLEFVSDFKDYAKRNIIEPMANFWKPVNQMLKNVIQNTGDKIKDHINDMFERTVGLPMHDFLQEKLFKPIGKVVFGILKAPIKLGKAILAAPFRALGGIGNSIRAGQIRRGTAYDMSASERLAWRDQHGIRFNKLNSWRDKARQEDELFANMSAEDLQQISMNARAGLDSFGALQRNVGDARKAVSSDISAFFNTKDSKGHTRFNRVKYKIVNQLTEIAQDGDIEAVNDFIDNMEGLTAEEKDELRIRIADKVNNAANAMAVMNNANRASGELDAEMTKLLGRKFKNRTDRRQIYKLAEAELRARKSGKDTESETPEVDATNKFAETYKEKTETIITKLIEANKYLQYLVDPDAKDTTAPGDQKAQDQEAIKGKSSSTSADDTSTENAQAPKDDAMGAIEQAENVVKNKQKKNKKSIFGNLFGNYHGKYLAGNGAGIDEDSKEAVDMKKQIKAKNQQDTNQANAEIESASILAQIKDKLFGKKNTEEKEGFAQKLMNGLTKVGKFLGIGGLSLVGFSFFGHASEWFKTSVWPKLKTALFGKEGDDTDGIAGKIKTGFKQVMLGNDGKTGILGKLRGFFFGDQTTGEKGIFQKGTEWLEEKIYNIRDWISGKGGLTGIFTDIIIPKFVTGLTYGVNNILAPLLTALLKAAPALLKGLGTAIWTAIRQVFDKKLPSGRTTIDDNNAGAEYLNSQKAINSALESGDNPSINALKTAFGSLGEALTGNSTDIDFSEDQKRESANYKSSGGILGVLGQKKRTNEIQYDEDGNIITEYTQFNTGNSIGSTVAKATGRSFLKGLAGHATHKAVKGVGKAAGKSAAGLLIPGGNKLKGVGNLIKSGVKGANNIISASGNLGAKLNRAINSSATDGKFISNIADTATNISYDALTPDAQDLLKRADDILGDTVVKEGTEVVVKAAAKETAETISEKGILAGIKKIFKNIAESKIGVTIAKFARKMTGKELTEKILKETFEKLAAKLGKTIIGKAAGAALKGVANVISKFSPLAIATFVIDFIWGFDNAHTILGVAKDGSYDVNIGMKCICGLVNLLTNFLTLGIIPADVIMDIVIEFLAPLFGIDTTSIDNARNEAEAAMDEWNKEHPEDQYDNLQDFNNKDKWWFKASKPIKQGWENVKQWGSNVWTDTKTAVSDGINKVKGTIDLTIDNLGNIGNGIKTGIGNIFKAAWDGKLIEAFKASVPVEGDNKFASNMSNIILGIFKYTLSPIITLASGIGLVKNGIMTVINAASQIIPIVKTGITDTFASANNGSLSGITKQLTQSTGNSTMDAIANVVFGVSKVYTTPIAVLTAGISNIKTAMSNIISKWSVAKSTKKADDAKIDDALDGKISVFSTKYWTNANHSNEGIFGVIANVQTYIEKIMNVPFAIIRGIGSSIKNSVEDVKEWFSGIYEDIEDFIDNPLSYIGNLFDKSNKSNKSSNKSGRGRNGGSHLYQSSGEFTNIPYGDSTLEEAGCAPIAAANLLNGMNRSAASTGVMDAARYAERHGKTVPGGGTDISYFNSYLGSKGISTSNTSSGSRVMDALKSGDQVIMLGQDTNDRPGSPFGTTPHFVTAKGISANGNIIAEDPDLPYSNIEYRPRDMMKSMITSVIADTNNGIVHHRHGKSRYPNKNIRYGRKMVAQSTINDGGSNKLSAQAIINIAKSQVGVGETGPNMCKYNDAYYGRHIVNSSQDSYQWCAVFVWWVFNQAGASSIFYFNGNNAALCSNILNAYKSRGLFTKSNPKPGDIVFFNFDGGSAIQHVGIVVKANNDNTVTTIEGNTGGDNTNGGYVMQRTRSRSVIIGFAHPQYPYTYSSAKVVNMSKWGDNTNYKNIAYYGGMMDPSMYTNTQYYNMTDSSSDDSNAVVGDGSYETSAANTLFSRLSELGTNIIKAIYGKDAYEALFGGENINNDTDYSNGTGTNPGTTMPTSYTTQGIWNALRSKGYSKAGTAGIMGNLNAESAYKTNNLQNSYEKSLGMTDEEYSNKVSNGSYSRNKFINDSAGYGLAQWTYWSRKQALYDKTVAQGKRIDDLQGQIDTIDSELKTGYKSLYNYLTTTTDVNTAADRVLTGYERPADQGQGAKNKRRNYAWTAYNTYGKGRSHTGMARPDINAGVATRALTSVAPKGTTNVTYNTTSVAPMVDYITFLKTIVEILINISNNTAMLSKILEILSTRFDINISAEEVQKASTNSHQQAERMIDEIISKNNNASNYARVINNKDTQYLVNAMMAIARE